MTEMMFRVSFIKRFGREKFSVHLLFHFDWMIHILKK